MKTLFRLVSGLILFLALAGYGRADVLKIKYVNEGETALMAREKSSGRPLWKSTLLVRRTSYQGRSAILARETGSGLYGSSRENLNWVFESNYFLENGQLIPGRALLTFNDQSGRAVRSLEKKYDPKGIYCFLNGKKQGFSPRSGLIGSELIGPFLSNYPFAEKKDLIFFLLTNEPTVYKMTVKYRGTEVVSNGHISLNCHKLEMIPDLGALGLLGAFVPKTYFWFEVDPPHRFFRYEGLESGLGTPYIIEEVADLVGIREGR